ncbi:E1 ubiquitin-activating protein uba2 [Saxophila tyrrhenica]|uniref:Ubiquitin-activating enzyme E1-like n=1 Tax=Saxophila tyrrhenica TaxID=1690608 RepID=A0AAV9NZG8_9PEZI|nr:E1 ubiquitin-activating protein uba2 [Saxophila tyrrhenica]
MTVKMQRRDRGVAQSLGGPLTKKVKESRVLLVGAGGIGCELLKNLVCSGFGSFTYPASATGAPAANGVSRRPEVVVIDLDTIDLSNLNRQFLFRKQHIKKPKAFVAKETAIQFNPSGNIDAHHASIFDSKYNVEFFEGFDVVFNALDNLAARRHVNKMCLAANVPLIESGTTGFNGQVQAIQKGVTECYDCNPKPVQKSFPICTIRSTPSQPIHCIVWAKSYLFPELFGASEDSGDMTVTEGDNVDEVAKLKEEADALKKIRSMMGKSEFAQEVFNKVFHDDVERLRSMTEMWQSRRPPEPLKFQSLAADSNIVKQGQALASQDQKPWTLLENIAVFCYSLDTLSNRVKAGENVIEFDKDDKDTLDFVASAANLRSHIFGVQLHSEWEVKQMAGNIIPAIATSNALTASLCVMEAFKILRMQQAKELAASNLPPAKMQGGAKDDGLLGGAKMVFLTSKSTDRLISSQSLLPPKAECPVCSPYYAKLGLPEASSPTLQELVDLLKERLSYEDDFSITAEMGIIYDPDLDDNLAKPLSEFGFTRESNGFITVTDDSDTPKVDLVLSSSSQSTSAEDAGAGTSLRLFPGAIELPLKPIRVKDVQTNGDSVERVPDSVAGAKRKRETEDEVESAKKRAKNDDVFVVEDDGGAILLDD